MVPIFRSPREGFLLNRLSAAIFCLLFFFLQATAAVSDVEMTGFRIVQETGDGRWEIKADKAYYDDKGDVILKEVSARMMKDGVEDVTVSSKNGRYESEGLILHLEGNVTVASSWGSRFEAPYLRWDGPRAVMVAERGVQLERGMLKVVGESVRYSVNSGTALVSGDVMTTLKEGRAPQ